MGTLVFSPRRQDAGVLPELLISNGTTLVVQIARTLPDLILDFPLESEEEIEVLPNPPAFECVWRGESGRLEKLSEDDLRVPVGGVTVLHYAAALGSVNCLKVLLRRLEATVDGELLRCADARRSFGDQREVINLLLQHETLTATDHKDGLTHLLNSAAYFGVEWMISFLLLEHGADVNGKESFGCTALIYASKNGHTDCARLLLEHGADVNLKGGEGRSALMEASEEDRVDSIRLLLEHGAEVNAADDYGWTALHIACDFRHTDCTRLLLEHGADGSLKDAKGRKAWVLAQK